MPPMATPTAANNMISCCATDISPKMEMSHANILSPNRIARVMSFIDGQGWQGAAPV